MACSFCGTLQFAIVADGTINLLNRSSLTVRDGGTALIGGTRIDAGGSNSLRVFNISTLQMRSSTVTVAGGFGM